MLLLTLLTRWYWVNFVRARLTRLKGREKKPLAFFRNSGRVSIYGFAVISIKRVARLMVDAVEKEDWNGLNPLIAKCELSLAVGALPDVFISNTKQKVGLFLSLRL